MVIEGNVISTILIPGVNSNNPSGPENVVTSGTLNIDKRPK